jgi:hypothetical protein
VSAENGGKGDEGDVLVVGSDVSAESDGIESVDGKLGDGRVLQKALELVDGNACEVEASVSMATRLGGDESAPRAFHKKAGLLKTTVVMKRERRTGRILFFQISRCFSSVGAAHMS